MNYQQFPHSRSLQVKDKPFNVYWSKSAEHEFQRRPDTLLAEMELKFACMVRMQVLFHEDIQHPKAIPVTDKLSVIYRPVVGESCKLSEADGLHSKGELNSGPMVDRHPRQLGIDFVRGAWRGEYV